MNREEAKQIIRDYHRNHRPTEEDFFMTTEALRFLIEEDHDPDDMLHLGGMYYETKAFDLAEKYYLMAAETDPESEGAHGCLGYIYYYGRTGEPDYEKALYHFRKSADLGNLQSAYKVADMYKNGYGTIQDYDRYVQIIEELWPQVSKAYYLNEPFPEVATRLAGIRRKQGKSEEAISLYLRAKSFLAQRLQHDAFFGNFSIMKWLIRDLRALLPFDPYDFDFYDLCEALRSPCRVTFYHKNKSYEVSSTGGEAPVITFQDLEFDGIDNFMQHAKINGRKISDFAPDFYYFEYQENEDLK